MPYLEAVMILYYLSLLVFCSDISVITSFCASQDSRSAAVVLQNLFLDLLLAKSATVAETDFNWKSSLELFGANCGLKIKYFCKPFSKICQIRICNYFHE